MVNQYRWYNKEFSISVIADTAHPNKIVGYFLALVPAYFTLILQEYLIVPGNNPEYHQ